MSVELRETRRRISSTQQIAKVSSALQKIAAARLTKDKKAVAASNGYMQNVLDLMNTLMKEHSGLGSSPLYTAKNPSAPAGIIFFGSGSGLCGGFNSKMISEFEDFLGARKFSSFQLITVGKVIARKAVRMGFPVARQFPQPPLDKRGAMVIDLANYVKDAFLAGSFSEVYVVYTRFVSVLNRLPTIFNLLPLTGTSFTELIPKNTEEASVTTPPLSVSTSLFEPDASTIFELLIPEFLRQIIDDAFLNSMASEDASRQEAMIRASENAKNMLSSLMLTYSRLRQELITTEMLEIAGSANAGK